MSKSTIATSAVLFLTLTVLLVFRKYLSLGVYHSVYYCKEIFGKVVPYIPRELNILIAMIGLVLIGLVLVRLVLAIRGLIIFRETRKRVVVLPGQLDKLTRGLGLKDSVRLIDVSAPLAFCFGIINPKIYLSTTVVQLMTVEELKAILLHEKHHLDNRDSMTFFLGRLIENLFLFFPLTTEIINGFRVRREIAADGYAIKVLGQKEAIISALRKLLLVESSPRILPAFADSNTLEERILALKGASGPKRISKVNVVLSCLGILGLLGIVVTPISAMEVHHNHADTVVVCVGSPTRNASFPATTIAH